MRIALLSTPRSGNNWLRYLLTTLYDVPGLAINNPDEADWHALPPGCVLGIHWYRTPDFLARLQAHGFRPVVIARHPLDVFISILQYALHHNTDRWVESAGGTEHAIVGAWPCSFAFLDYCRGPRAAALHKVTHDWWHAPESRRVRYEDLHRDPVGEIRRLVSELGGKPRKTVEQAVAANSLSTLREKTESTHHFWQGKVGLWKSLLPAGPAQAIAAAHERFFRELGYACDPDWSLDGSRADANWRQMVWGRLGEDLRQLEPTRRALAVARAELAAAQQALAAAQAESQAARECLKAVQELGPGSLPALARFGRLALRYPRTFRVVKRALRLVG